jgi:threonine/homoserine/homoserine lactone efflux protein
MLYLAYRIGTAAPLVDRMEAPVPGLLPGMLLAIANPKAYVAISAVYTKTVLASGSALFDAILKCVILSSAIIFIHLTWALAGTALTTVLRDPRVSRGVNLALAAALILAVVADGIKWLTPMIGTVADVGRRLQLLCCIGVTSGAGTAGAGLSP